MAKFKVDIASQKTIPGKPQALAPVKPSELIVTAVRDNGNFVNVDQAAESIVPVVSVNVTQTQGVVSPFGSKRKTIIDYPNDTLRFDLFNANNVYLGTNYRVDNYTFQQTISGSTVVVDVESNIQQLGYLAGRYNYTYRFHRNILGSGDGHKLSIQEISSNGLELRVRPVLSATFDNTQFVDQFVNGIFQTPKSELLTNLFLFRDESTFIPVFDFVQDRFTINTSPYSIIFKLSSPVPSGVSVGDELWLAQQVSDDYSDIATLIPPSLKPPTQTIAGPNFDILARTGTGISTNYKDRDDIVTTNTSIQYQLQDKLISGSLVEGINLNQDFRKFENFVNYSSAESRVRAFYYKLRQVESYNIRINQLTVDLNGLPSSSATSSTAFISNLQTARNRRSAVIGSFDAYERYLYYESASYESSSYGEFWPTTWPKSTSIKPYTNVPTTSSMGVDWFEGAISSASLYDTNNIKALTKSTPAHIVEDLNNENYLTLIQTVGHYFDDVLPYVQQITSQYNRDQSISAGLSKDLLYVIGQNLGFEFENGNALDDLWDYALGVDATGSINTSYETSTEETMKGIWKRIINNLPYLLKTKGTERGLRALINCFGIPETILRIREYGGHEADFESKSDYIYERFNYSTTIGYNGATSGTPFGIIRIPWQVSRFNSRYPQTIELRAKMAASQTKTQKLVEKTGSWFIEASKSGSSQFLTLYLGNNNNNNTTYTTSTAWATASISCSIYDGDWNHITIRRETESDSDPTNQIYTLALRTVNYEKVAFYQTASIVVNGGTSQSYNQAWTYNSPSTGSFNYLFIPATGSFTTAQSHSAAIWSGSVQEVRFWTTPLQDSILDNHALAPTSYQGNTDGVRTGSTSSFNTLYLRLPLGSDGKKVDVTSSAVIYVSSSHPNQNISYNTSGIAEGQGPAFLSFAGNPYVAEKETYSVEWPDLGANRSLSNKIRIDSTVLSGNQLYTDARAEKPLTDNYPPDSPRLGVFLSPTNEVNQDIAEQFGGISIDDYIGDPTYLELDNYPALAQLQREYGKKYIRQNKPNQYSRLLQFYNAALFQLIKSFVPHRANTQVGLVIEPTIIERSKLTTKLPVATELDYSASINLTNLFPPSGEVEDPTNTPLANYVAEAVIGGDETDYLTLSGSAENITPINDTTLTVISNTLSGSECYLEVDGTVDLGVTSTGWNARYLGSKYVYMTYASSGSNPRTLTYVTASRYDEYEAIEPVILDNTYSSHFAPAGKMYDRNIYYSRLFTGQRAFTASVQFSSSDGTYNHPLTNNLGLRLSTTYSGSVVGSAYGSSTYGTSVYGGGGPQAVTPYTGSIYWTIDNTNGLYFKPYTTPSGVYSGSFAIDAFMYEDDLVAQNRLYRVTITTQLTGSSGDPAITLYFGGFDSPLTQSYTLSGTQTITYTTKATGTELGVAVRKSSFSNAEFIKVVDLKVEPLNYRAQVQDYHLVSSRGMINARYEGCKLTSTDYNVDSPDTVDNGPVITITVGGGKVLSASPSTQAGTFTIQ